METCPVELYPLNHLDVLSPLVLQLILFRQDMLCSSKTPALIKKGQLITFSDTDPFLCSLLLVFPSAG